MSATSENYNLPFSYDFINRNWGLQSPSTVHCKNTALSYMFQRYLFQRAMSVFKWTLPKEINPYYFNYVFFTFGYIGLFKHDKYGAVALYGTFDDYDLYYYPKYMTFTSPAFEIDEKREIGKTCILFNLQGNFSGFYDLVSFYADAISLLFEDAGVSMVNTKLSKVFVASNKNASESFKAMFDKLNQGDPAVFIDRNLMDDEGNPRWLTFDNDVSKNYIIDKLLIDVEKLLKLFDQEIGINSVNTEKKERLIEAEAVSNEDEATSRVEMWLENLQNECKKAKELLGIDIWVELRNKKKGEEKVNEQETSL